MVRRWTVAEDAQLRKMRASRKPASVIAKELKRTEAAIVSRKAFLDRREDAPKTDNTLRNSTAITRLYW